MDNKEVLALLRKYDKGDCNAEEQALVETWYLKQQVSMVDALTEPELKKDLHEIFISLPGNKSHTLSLWMRVAAAVVLISAVGLYFYATKNGKDSLKEAPSARNIAPGKNSATLTLANGRRIVLSDSLRGQIAIETGITITKSNDGQIVYTLTDRGHNHNVNPVLGLNALSTSRGQQYQLVLPDGTHVWLNAASSIEFPASFAGMSHRKVSIKGEVYFEVVKDKNHPFLVESRGQQITVLGTHFNVNSYMDETSVKTSLVEGRIQVKLANGKSKVLTPGQQSWVNGTEIRVTDADTEAVVDWKDGNFYFLNENIESVMRKISRWYNIEVVYAIKDHDVVFGGEISRSKDLSQVLSLLEATKSVHFKVEGRRIFVMD